MTSSVHTVDQENVSATLTIAVPAARVFAVLADPAAHSAIDGTGWVQDAVDRAPLTEVGQIFRMDMYHPGHRDGDYAQGTGSCSSQHPLNAVGENTGVTRITRVSSDLLLIDCSAVRAMVTARSREPPPPGNCDSCAC